MSDDRHPFDDLDDYDDRPRRRRRHDFDDGPRWGDERDDYDDRPAGENRPEDRVRAPGTAMAVAGWVGIALTLVTLALILVFGLENPPPHDELVVNLVVGAVLGSISVVYFAVIAAGGHRMRQCRGYGLAMTAAVLAIASVTVLGVCSVVTLPFGIWAVVVLSQADVRRAFERARRASD